LAQPQGHQAIEDSLRKLNDILRGEPQWLRDHLARTRDVALKLAAAHDVPADKVELAALGHDLARAYSEEALLRETRSLGLDIRPVEERVPILLHGPVAAELLRRRCGVTDPEVLEAVRWHSTAVRGMGRIGLVVFLADKVEPHKVQQSPELQEIATLARSSLERAAAEYLTIELALLLKRGALLHPASVDARNDLLSRL
jgi:predicted HD superfamily hydrolase involved in NAD metabolism